MLTEMLTGSSPFHPALPFHPDGEESKELKMEIWGGQIISGSGCSCLDSGAGSDPKLTLKIHLSNTGCNEVHANVAFKELRETWENNRKRPKRRMRCF